jgi:hypothetical protein
MTSRSRNGFRVGERALGLRRNLASSNFWSVWRIQIHITQILKSLVLPNGGYNTDPFRACLSKLNRGRQLKGRFRMKASSGFGRLAFGLSFILLGAFTLAMATTNGYHLLKKYSFGAAEGSTREYFDYITVDSSARRVYVSHGTEVKVIDADSGALIGNVIGLKQATESRSPASSAADSSATEPREK